EAEIAGEKAGILKPSIPVVMGRLRAEAAEVVRARAEVIGAKVISLGEHFAVDYTPEVIGANAFRFSEKNSSAGGTFEMDAVVSMPGRAARENAGLAIACVRALQVHAADAFREAARIGLAQCELPARIEILRHDSEVIVDAAHTAESARLLAEALGVLAPNGYELILSVSSDKNFEALLAALLPGAHRVWLTKAEPTRSLAIDVMADRVRALAPNLAIETVENPELAARRARAELAEGLRLCAAGSIYLAGIVRRVLGEADERSESESAPARS
ncbi:MAG: hypothetical protein VCB25_08010, partial [Myxococcota bacterium]